MEGQLLMNFPYPTPLFGVAYYDEYIPFERLHKDFQMMKDAKINVIRIAESTWSTLEPADNQFDFSSIDRVLTMSELYDIKVIVGTPTYAIPAWLAKLHPDILVENQNGQVRYGPRQNMDITNPHYRFYSERVIRTLLHHIKNRPTIIGFQLDNETKHYNTSCERVQIQFVEWIRDRYEQKAADLLLSNRITTSSGYENIKTKSLELFNHDFGLSYWSNRINSWDEFPDIRGTINASLGAEFEKFKRNLVTEFLCWQADIVEEYRRPEQFTTQNFDFEWRGYSFGLQPMVCQGQAARALTVAGVDIYHPSQNKLSGAEIAFGGAIGRSLARHTRKTLPESAPSSNYLVLETQAQGNPSWLPYPGQLRLQAYSHLSSGSNSVMYWHWHSIHNSFETYWKGILSHDFMPNSVYEEAKRIGSEFTLFGDHLIQLKKTNTVAILLSNESLTGMDYFPIDDGCCYNDIVRWLFDSCYRLNLECDVIYDWELNKNPDFLCDRPYELLLIPALYSASESVLLQIESYVQHGGNAVMTFKSGFSNDVLQVYPAQQPYLLTRCFGLSYNQFTIPDGEYLSLKKDLFSSTECPAFKDRAPLAKTSPSVPPIIPALHWMELLQPETATVWANYSSANWSKYAAITHHEYGKGSATYLGCYFDPDALDCILHRLIKVRHLTSCPYQYPLIIKKGCNQYDHNVYYFLNYSDTSISFSYDYEDGIELCTHTYVKTGQKISLPPWGITIIEQNGVI